MDIVYQIVTSPSGWYAARNSGLYFSINQGQSWQSAYASLNLSEPLPTLALAVPPAQEQSPIVFAGLDGGLLRSLHGVDQWESLPLPSPLPTFTALVSSPEFEKDGLLFAGTMQDGVLIFTNPGPSWAAWNFGLQDANMLCLACSPDFARDQMLLAGVQSGLFRSTNAGRSWQEIDLPVGYVPVLCIACSPDFAQDGVIFTGTETQGLLRSSDGGQTWHQLLQEPLAADQPLNAILLGRDYPAKPEILILYGSSLLYSPDDGLTWQPWLAGELNGQEVTACAAPQGFSANAPIIVGLAGGEIRLLSPV
ncbi:MAG: hypothetical protein AB1894_13590 [Chloroflexota bacterium]